MRASAVPTFMDGQPFGLMARGLGRNRPERWQSPVVWITPSLHPLLQQKPIALCFECLVAAGPYLIPWVYNCSPSPLHPELPPAIIFSPSCLPPADRPSPTPLTKCRFQSVEFHLFFYLIASCFPDSCEPSRPPWHCTWSPLRRPAQAWPWERPVLNIVVCWRQHGVMRMRPGKLRRGSLPWVFFLSDV